ncbi:MAG TPA: glycosyltransferase family A protein [Afipia sp.]
MSRPAITVVIPTYNWSAALRCAIRSVLLQTEQNFEIMVVGDGCTDDSAAVVASFNDPRIRWHNLERNYGSQWAANNYAIERAASDWIAYLGHDDIWYPTHLEAILRAARTHDAEVVTSVMALYGPPDSGVRGMAGLFGSGNYSATDFVPPSAFAHAKSIYGDSIKWQDPASVTLPMDALFMNQAAMAAKRYASTRELTSFKFNAAWRRDSYKIKSVAEQQRMLERIESKVDFRSAELIDILQAVVSYRFQKIEMPSTHGMEPGWFVRFSRKNKGSESRYTPSEIQHITRKVRFNLSGQTMPFEWHGTEKHLRYGSFRWTGPSRRSTIDLPVRFEADLKIRIVVINSMVPREEIRILLRDQPLHSTIRKRLGKGFIIEAVARVADIPPSNRDFGITIEVDATRRPCDLGRGEDSRWLGVAVARIQLEPLTR